MVVALLVVVSLGFCVLGWELWEVRGKLDRLVNKGEVTTPPLSDVVREVKKKVKIYRDGVLYHVTGEGSYDHREAEKDDRFVVKVE